jgi:hypothetical protein
MKKVSSLAIASLFVLSTASASANTLVERFATDPALDGWQIFGDTNLFHWDSTNQNLVVTWDSSQPNSYFHHPLGRTLTTNDSFCVQFDLQLSDAVAAGYGSEVAVGLLHFADAASPDFNRENSPLPDLFEFDYTPAIDYGGYSAPDTIEATLKDSQPGYEGFFWVVNYMTLQPGVTYRIMLVHRAGEPVISGSVYTNGQFCAAMSIPNGNGTVGDFQFDTLSVSSFQDGGNGNTVLAHGTVGNLAVASPLPVQTVQAIAAGKVQFVSDTNWLYTLEQSADLQTWSNATPGAFGNGTNLVLQAANLPAGKSFYRVRADLP